MRIQLDTIHKHYGTTRANDGVSFTIEPGEILGLLGENGAGKSTLMKILAGYIPKTSGTILADGEPVEIRSPADATALGIGMLYQDPMDFLQLTVLENFMIGQTGGKRLAAASFRKQFQTLSERLGFTIHPDTPVRTLTVGERQQLEILRLLSCGTRILILDEPTTGISPVQKQILFDALKTLVSEGKSVLLVSHKLEDVDALCDRVVVLREGKVTGSHPRPFDANHLLSMMFDHLPQTPTRANVTPGETVLELRDAAAAGGRTGLSPLSFTIRAGEVVGLAGLEGSGQGVLLRAAAGVTPLLSGQIYIDGKKFSGKGAVAFRDAGIRFLPTDRLEEGLVPGMSITEHWALNDPSPATLYHPQKAKHLAEAAIKNFRVKGFSDSVVESLSGGNQQRLLLSFLPEIPRLLLLENPTRGLDLESAHWVWTYLHDFARQHRTAILFSSAELDEILAVADRVLVFYDGNRILDRRTDSTNAAELGSAIAGRMPSATDSADDAHWSAS